MLFQRGAFDAAASGATAGALAAYAAGLPAFVLVKVLAPGYFSREDTKTPLKIAVVCLIVNATLNLILMGPLGHIGIALASAISSWLNAGLLGLGLARRGHLKPDARLRRAVPRMVLAAAFMAATLWGAADSLVPWLAAGLGLKVLALAVLVAIGMATFAVLAQLSGAVRLGELSVLLRR